jgi:Asp-tRNA(Asn)/Glu-tRNA(Gln) amidotransferase A subunit family amidase
MAAGPMAKDVDALAACMRVFFSDYLWRLDGSIPRMPFNQDTYEGSGRLKIGYYLADGFFPSTPPCERAVVVACDALREAGHELVPFNPPEVRPITLLSWLFFESRAYPI